MRLKFFVLLAFTVFALGINAQTEIKDSTSVSNKPVFRAEAGYSQLLRYGGNISTTPYYNLFVGGNVEFKLKYNLGIQTGLHYNYSINRNKTQYFGNNLDKNNNGDYKDEGDYIARDTVKYSYSNHSLDVPVRLTYTLPIFWGLKVFGYAGPNFNIGLFEPTTVKANKNLYVNSDSYDAYQNNLYRLNVQFGAGGGIQWKSYRVKSGYDWGILNIGKTKNVSQYKRNWFVSLEYEF